MVMNQSLHYNSMVYVAYIVSIVTSFYDDNGTPGIMHDVLGHAADS